MEGTDDSTLLSPVGSYIINILPDYCQTLYTTQVVLTEKSPSVCWKLLDVRLFQNHCMPSRQTFNCSSRGSGSEKVLYISRAVRNQIWMPWPLINWK